MTVRRPWLQSLAALVFSVVVAAGGHFFELTTSLQDALHVAVTTWLVGMMVQMTDTLHTLHVRHRDNQHVLEVTNDVDHLLVELQLRFREMVSRELSGRRNHVFIDYCSRSIRGTLEVVQRAAQRGELEVRDHHFGTVDKVVAAFEGCGDRMFRCVWLLESGEALFDPYWREYMTAIVHLSRRMYPPERVGARILFVADDEGVLQRPSVQIALRFVAMEGGFMGTTISKDDYLARLADNNLDNRYLDFGIYGDHLLFRTTSYEPHAGVFCDDQEVIGRYRHMHNDAMTATGAMVIGAGLRQDVTLEQFLKCDEAG